MTRPSNPFTEFPTLLANLAALDEAAEQSLAELRQWYETNVRDCPHSVTKIYKVPCRNGIHQYKKQCQTCGHVSGAVAYRHLSKHDRDTAGEKDESIRPRHFIPYYQIRNLFEELREEARRIRWAPGFREIYMASPQWALKRLKVMRRANYRCETCKAADAEEIHHVTYSRLGNEDLEHLKAMCGPCHRRLSIELGHIREEE